MSHSTSSSQMKSSPAVGIRYEFNEGTKFFYFPNRDPESLEAFRYAMYNGQRYIVKEVSLEDHAKRVRAPVFMSTVQHLAMWTSQRDEAKRCPIKSEREALLNEWRRTNKSTQREKLAGPLQSVMEEEDRAYSSRADYVPWSKRRRAEDPIANMVFFPFPAWPGQLHESMGRTVAPTPPTGPRMFPAANQSLLPPRSNSGSQGRPAISFNWGNQLARDNLYTRQSSQSASVDIQSRLATSSHESAGHSSRTREPPQSTTNQHKSCIREPSQSSTDEHKPHIREPLQSTTDQHDSRTRGTLQSTTTTDQHKSLKREAAQPTTDLQRHPVTSIHQSAGHSSRTRDYPQSIRDMQSEPASSLHQSARHSSGTRELSQSTIGIQSQPTTVLHQLPGYNSRSRELPKSVSDTQSQPAAVLTQSAGQDPHTGKSPKSTPGIQSQPATALHQSAEHSSRTREPLKPTTTDVQSQPATLLHQSPGHTSRTSEVPQSIADVQIQPATALTQSAGHNSHPKESPQSSSDIQGQPATSLHQPAEHSSYPREPPQSSPSASTIPPQPTFEELARISTQLVQDLRRPSPSPWQTSNLRNTMSLTHPTFDAPVNNRHVPAQQAEWVLVPREVLNSLLSNQRDSAFQVTTYTSQVPNEPTPAASPRQSTLQTQMPLRRKAEDSNALEPARALLADMSMTHRNKRIKTDPQ
ncbi:hypothetical protein HYFRA_00012114 [Hymenoscyphus fraxineus]|uniref:Uncharacterized protein n=1 Tax=Hymenoscyphus fraxineus TaxID=746836 RepID=A0A9N9PW41_9HELO|nr:hypothetical protein HYFRA_00012114 [Hymenoscyphus fraxineus]